MPAFSILALPRAAWRTSSMLAQMASMRALISSGERKITEPELFVSRCAAHADETDFPAVYSAFKKALPGEKAQKAISSIMHQGGLGDLTATMLKAPMEPEDGGDPVELFKLPGAQNALPARHERE